MKKMIPLPLIAVALVTTLFVSCKKDDDNDGPKSNTEKITLSPWKFDNLKIDMDGDGTGETNGDDQVEACDKDNLYTFQSNGTGTLDAGAQKCDQEPQTTNFTWTFKENETIIHFPTAIVEGVDGDVTLVSLTESSMVLSKKITLVGPFQPTFILTLKH